MSAAEVCLIQFAKRPVAGFVKTRLMPALGPFGALNVHATLLKNTLQMLHDSKLGVLQLWWDKEWSSDEFLAATTVKPSQYIQQGEDLGARMCHALASGLESYRKVLLVGSDCPVLSKSYLLEALATLDHNDIVLGAAEDGGYVLIGARTLCAGVLRCAGVLGGIPWGTATVLSDTLQNLKLLGLSCGLLDPLYDVDEFVDYQRWQAETVI
jgi:rSAM/selenodomain-associated transferase 1